MNRKELKCQVNELLDAGKSKPEVYARLLGAGVKDRQLQLYIAAYPDPHLCHVHDRKVNLLITMMFAQALIGALVGFGMGNSLAPGARWTIAALAAMIPFLFAWGFYRHKAVTYNVYIVLTLIQLPKALSGFQESPMATSIALAINLSMLAYVWYVRGKVFPDFTYISSVKRSAYSIK